LASLLSAVLDGSTRSLMPRIRFAIALTVDLLVYWFATPRLRLSIRHLNARFGLPDPKSQRPPIRKRGRKSAGSSRQERQCR
jgi:hypothetical protein